MKAAETTPYPLIFIFLRVAEGYIIPLSLNKKTTAPKINVTRDNGVKEK